MPRRVWTAGMFAALALTTGCLIVDSSDGEGGADGDGGQDGQGGAPIDQDAPRLFVLNRNMGVSSYSDPAQQDGRIEATTTLVSGAETDMFGPRELAVGPDGDLYVLAENDSAIVVYADALEADGAVLPSRKLAGPTTGLNFPVGMALDTDNDVLYVLNIASDGTYDNAIFAFAGASSVDGDTAPARRIDVDFPYFSPLQVVWHDGSLYVVSQDVNTSLVLVFENANDLDGTIAPTSTIANTAFSQILSIHVDDQALYAVDDEAQLFVYESGAATPSATIDIAGASKLSAIAFDAQGTMFLADSSANLILSFNGGVGTETTASPSHTFDSVGLILPSRLVVVEP